MCIAFCPRHDRDGTLVPIIATPPVDGRRGRRRPRPRVHGAKSATRIGVVPTRDERPYLASGYYPVEPNVEGRVSRGPHSSTGGINQRQMTSESGTARGRRGHWAKAFARRQELQESDR